VLPVPFELVHQLGIPVNVHGANLVGQMQKLCAVRLFRRTGGSLEAIRRRRKWLLTDERTPFAPRARRDRNP
jgi:hypothetical protein